MWPRAADNPYNLIGSLQVYVSYSKLFKSPTGRNFLAVFISKVGIGTKLGVVWQSPTDGLGGTCYLEVFVVSPNCYLGQE